MRSRALALAPALLVTVPLAAALTGCGALQDAPSASAPAASSAGAGSADGGATAQPASVAVEASDTACAVARTDLPNGATTFSITNTGSQVTEVYVYDGERIVTEKEDIGPGTSYDLTVDLTAGSYQVACKPGTVGDGIRQAISVTGTASPLSADEQAAVTAYRTWVQQQADAAVPLVRALRDAVAAGDRTAAQAAYAPSRMPWERIEPVAESFGDLDPRMDAREADLEEGDAFTGWHRLEKALWTGEDLAPMTAVADQLLADATELAQRVPNAALTPTSIGNGAKELLDEVATGKVTGEEEAFSHTDLADFAANVEGARQAFTDLRPVVQASQPALVTTLDQRFAAVAAALAPYRTGTATDAFRSYEQVDDAGRRALAQVVDGLAEPLSQLGAAASGAGA